jgi:hypothetical protein
MVGRGGDARPWRRQGWRPLSDVWSTFDLSVVASSVRSLPRLPRLHLGAIDGKPSARASARSPKTSVGRELDDVVGV